LCCYDAFLAVYPERSRRAHLYVQNNTQQKLLITPAMVLNLVGG
jgi:hypothetical protein